MICKYTHNSKKKKIALTSCLALKLRIKNMPCWAHPSLAKPKLFTAQPIFWGLNWGHLFFSFFFWAVLNGRPNPFFVGLVADFNLTDYKFSNLNQYKDPESPFAPFQIVYYMFGYISLVIVFENGSKKKTVLWYFIK